VNKLSQLIIASGVTVLLSPVAAAVEQATSNEPEVERIEVTGSHLKGVDMEGALPVVTISEQDIRESGATTVIDLISQLPQFGGGAGTFSTSQSGSKQGDSPAGAAGISLRGLGTSSTLTLLNGRRLSVSSFANGNESFVDVNAIPLAAVERVEILTSGASAIYGADAVAGVVNFILKKDFTGLEIDAKVGDSEASSDDTTKSLSLTYGAVKDKLQLLATLDYYDRNALYDRDRDSTAVEPRPSQQGIWPSFNDLYAMGDDYVEADCPAEQRVTDGPLGEYCALNRNAYTITLPEIESISSLLSLTYTFDSGTEWFNELIYSSKESSSNSEPAPFSGEDAPVSYYHPDMPDELRGRFDQAGVDPDYPIFAWGRFPDPRTVDVESENYRIVSGLRGEYREWDWQTSLQWGRNENTQKAIAGIYNVEGFKAALNGELCADGSTYCSPDDGGLWYNVFAGQTDNDLQVVDLLQEQVPRDGESELLVVDVNASGDLFELPAGEVSMAFGAEYRYEEVKDQPSELATADPNNNNDVPVFGFGSTAAEADRWAYAIFSEFAVPVTEQLNLQLAARYDEYESFGGDISLKTGFRYQPIESLIIRGAWAESFRAPSLAQAGAGTTLGSGSLPCSGEFLDNFCAGYDEDDGYLTEVYGNPDLEAETADSYNLGFVWSPTQAFTFKLDYWRFKHENLVGTDDEQLFRMALEDPQLVAAEDSLATGQLGIETRDGTIGSPVEEIHLQLVNFGYQETDGVDISTDYRLDTDGLGGFTFYLDATYLNSFDRQLSSGSDDEKLAGSWRYPRWLANAGIKWSFGDFYTSLRAEYTHSYDDDDERSGVPEGREVASWTTFDLHLSYDITQDQFVSLDVNNLFDREPPVALGSAANVDLVNHDSMGRYFTLGYVIRF